MKIEQLIQEMTLEEKASLCSGLNFWHSKPIERRGIPSILMTDGPHGLRKQASSADHLGLNASVPATCFPTASALACSWDKNLLQRVGVALGEECQAEGVSILLGPGVNIKRSPLCGRNFEYFSEDPYLSTQLAKHQILGVQSQGVGTSIKHFAVNNQEHRRMTTNASVDERTLREIYLASFETAIKEAKPWTVMCAYNKVNGEYASEHPRLLTDILRHEWNYEGFVVSDWGAVNDRDKGLAAGLELQMPADGGRGDALIVEAVKNKTLKEEVLDEAVRRLLNITQKAIDNKKANASYDAMTHHELAQFIASECIVLLKNEDQLLPVQASDNIAIIGDLAIKPRFQGGGSSHINPTKVDIALDEIKKLTTTENLTFAKGYELSTDEINPELLNEAIEVAKSVEKVVLFIGLPERYESEGFDRSHLNIPCNQAHLVEEILKVNPNVIFVLSNGSAIQIPAVDKVKAILEAHLTGQGSGKAIADVLFGVVNPSGKLAETFPLKLEDNPSYLNFPGDGDEVNYCEGIYVGYRYYDKKKMETMFSFGHGLSYTTFEYSDLTVDKSSLTDDEELTVTVNVKNTGTCYGKDVVQLYVRDVASTVVRPEKELKGFEKVGLAPGEETLVTFKLDKRSFAYYNVNINDWHVETGDFEILIGHSSNQIVLSETVHVTSTNTIKPVFTKNSTLADIAHHPIGAQLVAQISSRMSGDVSQLGEGDIVAALFGGMPLRTLAGFDPTLPANFIDQLVEQLNQN